MQRIQQRLDAAGQDFRQAFARGDFVQALKACKNACSLAPNLSTPWADKAVCHVRLNQWNDAIAAGLHAVKLGSQDLGTYDALAHAYGGLEQWDMVRKYGLHALNLRMARFGNTPAPELALPSPGTAYTASTPPPPSVSTRAHNVIAFSLFGQDPKYCEAAVLNASAAAHIYPHWTCHFYIDHSVPNHVLQRLQQHGAVLHRIDRPNAAMQALQADQGLPSPPIQPLLCDPQGHSLPGPMWRFYAQDLPGLHRAIYRDADSIINPREACAVNAWVSSGLPFHALRDAPTHTELLLAGLWGATGAALPCMAALMQHFMRKPLVSLHFADQYFLREYIWPYAKLGLLQHDSVFGFLDAEPFPCDAEYPRSHDFHVGCVDAHQSICVSTQAKEGSTVQWTLYRRIDNPPKKQERGPAPQNPALQVEASEGQSEAQSEVICTYSAQVQQQQMSAALPREYIRAIQAQHMWIQVTQE